MDKEKCFLALGGPLVIIKFTIFFIMIKYNDVIHYNKDKLKAYYAFF